MVKIEQLEVENLKRIKACTITPAESGLTVIGGKNGQGKTSALDAIAWSLGGEKYRPSQAQRNDSVLPPHLKVTLSNGIVVERAGKNSALKVTDQTGKKSGQQLLNEFISQLAIDLPKFMQASNKEKADSLLRIIGVGDKLVELEQAEARAYDQRRALGQIADRKKKFAEEAEYFPGVPEEPVSASALIRQQQDILAKNGENQRKRDRLKEITHEKESLLDQMQRMDEQIRALQLRRADVSRDYEIAQEDEATALKTAAALQDESTAELEESIARVDEINRKVRTNLDKEKAAQDAEDAGREYNAMTTKVEDLRSQRMALLDGAHMPLPGLSVEQGELTYNGQKWDCMSSAEQLIVGTAIAKTINPACGFVLLDKLEQMDLDTLRNFGVWLESENLQVIATRVSTGNECSIIIEDGLSVEPERNITKTWKEGVF